MGAIDVSEKQNRYIERVRATERAYTIKWYAHAFLYNVLQGVIVAGAAAVPFLLNIGDVPKIIPTIISIVVAIAAALMQSFKYGERRRLYRLTSVKLRREIEYFDVHGGEYQHLNQEQAFQRFLERTEKLIYESVKDFFTLEEIQDTQQEQEKLASKSITEEQ